MLVLGTLTLVQLCEFVACQPQNPNLCDSKSRTHEHRGIIYIKENYSNYNNKLNYKYYDNHIVKVVINFITLIMYTAREGKVCPHADDPFVSMLDQVKLHITNGNLEEVFTFVSVGGLNIQ